MSKFKNHFRYFDEISDIYSKHQLSHTTWLVPHAMLVIFTSRTGTAWPSLVFSIHTGIRKACLILSKPILLELTKYLPSVLLPKKQTISNFYLSINWNWEIVINIIVCKSEQSHDRSIYLFPRYSIKNLTQLTILWTSKRMDMPFTVK